MYESKKKYFYGTGRRKSSVARVRVYENGTGSIIVNGRDIDEYFGLDTLKLIVRQPLVTTDLLGKVDIVVLRRRRRRIRSGRCYPPRHFPRSGHPEPRVPRFSEGRWLHDPRPQNEGKKEVRPQSSSSRSAVQQALISELFTQSLKPNPRNPTISGIFRL